MRGFLLTLLAVFDVLCVIGISASYSGSSTTTPTPLSITKKCTSPNSGESVVCYWLTHALTATYLEALVRCGQQNGTLAVVDSQAVHEFLVKASLDATQAWIGLTDAVTEGVFRWTNGKVIGKYNRWGVDQPDSANEEDDCVAYSQNQMFGDFNCSSERQFVCQSIPDGFYCLPEDVECAPWIHEEFVVSNDTSVLCDNETVMATDLMKDTAPEVCSETLCARSVYFVCQTSEEDSSQCRASPHAKHPAPPVCSVKTSQRLYTRNYSEPYRPIGSVFLQGEKYDYSTAVGACQNLNWRLLTVQSLRKHALLKNASSWLGLSERNIGAWGWFSRGSKVGGVADTWNISYTLHSHWAPGQPKKNETQNRVCAFRESNGLWTTANCSEKRAVVCEHVENNCKGVTCSGHGRCEELLFIGKFIISGGDRPRVGRYVCRCYPGFRGTHCEHEITVLLYTYVTIRVKQVYDDAYADSNSLQARTLRVALKQEVTATLLRRMKRQLAFVNVVWLGKNASDTMANYEIGAELNIATQDRAELKESVQEGFTRALEDGALDQIKVDPKVLKITDPRPYKDLCAEDPCGGQGDCVSTVNTFVCACQPGYAGPTCQDTVQVDQSGAGAGDPNDRQNRPFFSTSGATITAWSGPLMILLLFWSRI